MISAWIAALRLKTLPLAIGAIVLGSRLATITPIDHADQMFRIEVFGLALLTAVLLQILSNLANDYGDYTKGTDKHRADRQLSGGHISPKAMKVAIWTVVFLSLLSGLALLYLAFGTTLRYWLIFLGLGVISILAAVGYTVGKRAYGYFGLGDLFVFLFFGMLGVLGTAFLYRQQIDGSFYLPAIAYGCMCVGVLNINNIRDLDKDILSGKITLASKLGKVGAERYQTFLLLLAVLCLAIHHLMTSYASLAPIGLAVLSYSHLTALQRAATSDDYNAQLKFLSLSSLGVVILFVLRLFV